MRFPTMWSGQTSLYYTEKSSTVVKQLSSDLSDKSTEVDDPVLYTLPVRTSDLQRAIPGGHTEDQ